MIKLVIAFEAKLHIVKYKLSLWKVSTDFINKTNCRYNQGDNKYLLSKTLRVPFLFKSIIFTLNTFIELTQFINCTNARSIISFI